MYLYFCVVRVVYFFSWILCVQHLEAFSVFSFCCNVML